MAGALLLVRRGRGSLEDSVDGGRRARSHTE